MIEHKRSDKYSYLETLGMGPYTMKKIKVCPHCGRIAGRWALFCPDCRRPLKGKTLFDQYRGMHLCCAACGTPLAEDTRFCPHCGQKSAVGTNLYNKTDKENTK